MTPPVIMSLIELPLNIKARVVEVAAGQGLQNRFMSMGIYPGREIVKVSHFMMKGPVAIKVGRAVLALGFGMAKKIMVKVDVAPGIQE